MSSVPGVIRALNRSRVRYLLIGGCASVVHGVPLTTVDIDLAVAPETEDVRKALLALKRLGLEPETDRVDESLAQRGVSASNDRSVDLLTSLPGTSFEEVWVRRITVRYRGVRIPVVSRRDQIRLLRAAGRPQDLQDAEALQTKGGD